MRKQTEQLEGKLLVLIRIRGAPGMSHAIADTLKMLRLNRVNHSTVVWLDATRAGMLHKVKDYIAFGEITLDNLVAMMRSRGKIVGNSPLTDEWVAQNTQYRTIEDLAKAFFEGKELITKVTGLKPVFRLHPPKGGHRGTIKRAYNAGGTLGNCHEYVNTLLGKMV